MSKDVGVEVFLSFTTDKPVKQILTKNTRHVAGTVANMKERIQ